jgi:DNA repair exonuclease SbcCD ATPase subunit
MNKHRILVFILMIVFAALATRTSEAQSEAAKAPAAMDPTAALAQRLDQLSQKLSEQMQALEAAVKRLQERLGDSFERPTVFNNIERRLEDIEKRMDKLERNLEDLEDQVKRLERAQ